MLLFSHFSCGLTLNFFYILLITKSFWSSTALIFSFYILLMFFLKHFLFLCLLMHHIFLVHASVYNKTVTMAKTLLKPFLFILLGISKLLIIFGIKCIKDNLNICACYIAFFLLCGHSPFWTLYSICIIFIIFLGSKLQSSHSILFKYYWFFLLH